MTFGSNQINLLAKEEDKEINPQACFTEQSNRNCFKKAANSSQVLKLKQSAYVCVGMGRGSRVYNDKILYNHIRKGLQVISGENI